MDVSISRDNCGLFWKVEMDNGETIYIGNMDFDSIDVGSRHNSRVYLLSPNERKTLIAKIEKIIDGYGIGDCPTELRSQLKRLKEVA